ncbi:hypothetical protein IJ579_01800 [bacterium]|nr:hypothetical protein [bacterium]
MIVQKINFLPLRNVSAKHSSNKDSVTNPVQIPGYQPFAYQDYNINFTQRLFRTPANFYEQPFNKSGMPESMKAYLNADYSDRQNIPPAQMMKIVFGDIAHAKNLEEVKEMYPDEPLFTNLRSMPNKKYREGILAEISVMREEGNPIFKDGSDDLGLYILKKIYIEGKTLKEINKDFRLDISKDFEALSDINYQTLSYFGIKYPNRSFWHSFYVTREDFPYTYTPRKEIESRVTTQSGRKNERSYSDINEELKKPTQPPKFQPKDHEIKKLTDAFVKGKGSRKATAKELKNSFKKTDEKSQFVNKYFSEIMSVALEKIHASDEMKDFFENYDELDKTQKQKMEAYWQQNPLMKELQSIAISDTIKLFFITYGADGNNEEFSDLIDYAHSIKPAREERQIQHDMLQDEYEMALGIHDEPKIDVPEQPLESPKDPMDPENLDKLIEEVEKQNGLYEYHTKVHVDGDDVTILGDMKGETKALTKRIYGIYFPEKFVNKFANFIVEQPEVDDKYILTYHLLGQNLNINTNEDIIEKIILPDLEFRIRTSKIHKRFYAKYPNEEKAAQQAIIDGFYNKTKDPINSSGFYKYYPIAAVQYDDFPSLEDSQKFISEKYDLYLKPLSLGEANKINIILNSLLKKYDRENTTIIYNGNESDDKRITALKVLSLILKSKSQSAENLKISLFNYIKNDFGGSSRLLLDKNTPEYMKIAKMEQIVLEFIQKNNPIYKQIVIKYQQEMNKL